VRSSHESRRLTEGRAQWTWTAPLSSPSAHADAQ
jgi:hypothetical protein